MRDWPQLLDQLLRNDVQLGSSGAALVRSDRLIVELSERLIGFGVDPLPPGRRVSLPWVATDEGD